MSLSSRRRDGSLVSDYEYELPADRIASYPAERRDESRLLVLPPEPAPMEHGLFRKVVDLLEPGDVLVVVDEAYREFVTADLGDPITDLQPGHPNVVVLRTFSKAFGLAALRTGYAVADPEVVVELDKVLIAFAVNHLAQVASLAAIAARDEVQAVVDRITAERDRVVASLRADGWDLPDAHANFVYLPLGSRTDVVFPEMEKRGVVVRPFPGVGMRVTIGTPAQNDRFLATLAEVAAGS